MDSNLNQLKAQVYDKCGLIITDYQVEKESKEYAACRYKLNGRAVISRNSKITPKKIGQFVCFWKRNPIGIIVPFEASENFDFYIVNARTPKEFGQFVFPKTVLIERGIISTSIKEGKRAFRVYPKWDIAKNKQAIRTQNWQLAYFYIINESTNFNKVAELYNTEQI